MTSWGAVENQSYLSSITVTVDKAEHEDDEHLDWRLKVRDESGKQFDLEIWQKHDPLLEWEIGAKYEIRNAYGQTWSNDSKKKLHSSRKWSADRLDTTYDCRLMVMGDSHVGRTTHPKKSYKQLDCAGKFKEAVEVAVAYGVDFIIHTGDVFHDSASKDDCQTVESAFQLMQAQDIDFYYILGNHECTRGKRLLRHWECEGVATHLGMGGVETIADVKLYGYDHCPPSKFSISEMGVPSILSESTSILVLHQTLAPFREDADIDLSDITGAVLGEFNYVVSGHLHDPEQRNWDEGDFLYAGSTEDLSTKKDRSDPSVWVLTIDGNAIDTYRQKL